jgi:ribosome-binding factor A
MTITEVELSDDLKELKVYFSMLNKDEVKKTQDALNHAAGFIRSQLFHRLNIKKVPSISFIFDETPERAERVLRLLDRLKNEENKRNP